MTMEHNPAPGYPDCDSLADLLHEVADRYGDRPALIDRGRMFTFAQLDVAVSGLAAVLRQHAEPRSRCAVLMDNVFEHLVAWFAVQRADLVLVPVNVNLAAPEVAHQLEDAEAKTVAISPALVPKLDVALASTSATPATVRSVVLVHSWQEESGPDVTRPAAAAVVDVEPATLRPVESQFGTARTDLALIWYTSGTTGHPKGAAHTHDSCLNAIAAWVAEWDWTPEDRGLIRNLYHVGMMATVIAPLAVGASLVFSGPFAIDRYLSYVEDHRVTILRTFPVMLALMDKRPELLQRFDLSSVRHLGVGGSGIDDGLLHRSLERFPDVTWDYSWSQSELNSGGTNVSGDDWLERLKSCGRPIGCVKALTIQSESGSILAPGDVGEVCVQSTTEMTGYLHDESATREVKHNGWLHTGDLGYLDGDGYLYLVSRQREVIIRGGENVYPAEIEAVFMGRPDVEECAAVGIPDSVMGEVPVIFVVLAPGSTTTAAELDQLSVASLARYKRPTRIEFIDEVPRNGLGKVQRTILAEAGARYSR
jgi:acyl-CoA synthetase (AMP-forming)/AMP-acid ligase II